MEAQWAECEYNSNNIFAGKTTSAAMQGKALGAAFESVASAVDRRVRREMYAGPVPQQCPFCKD